MNLRTFPYECLKTAGLGVLTPIQRSLVIECVLEIVGFALGARNTGFAGGGNAFSSFWARVGRLPVAAACSSDG
jgi:hypothetical protein